MKVFNEEKRKIPIQSLNTCLNQVWHILFPNILL
jgi:hypothetical protein